MAWQVIDPRSARLYRRLLAFVAGASLAFYYGIFGGGFDADPRGFAAILIWAIIAVGLATGLFPRTRLPRGWQIAAGLFAALAAWTAFSLGWSESAEKTLIEVTRVLHYAGIVALAWLTLDRHTWSAAAAGLFAGAALITILALASRLAPSAFPVPDAAQFGEAARRLEYPFGYWNALGAWAAMTTTMALAWASHARATALRLASAAVIPVCAAVIYLTYSRGAVLAVAFGLLVTVFASERRWSAFAIGAGGALASVPAIFAIRDNIEIAEALGSAGAGTVFMAVLVGAVLSAAVVATVVGLGVDRGRVSPALVRPVVTTVAGILVLGAAVAVASGAIGDLWDRVAEDTPLESQGEPGSGQRDTSSRFATLGSSRVDAFESALDAYAAEPVVGIGAGTFEFWWAQNATNNFYFVDAHSIYLEALAELGPVGLALVVALLAWLALMVVQARRESHSTRRSGAVAAAAGTMAVFALQAGIDWFWEYSGLVALTFGSAALAACGRSGARRRDRLTGAWRTGLAIAALAILVVQVPPWSSIRAIRASQDALAVGDTRLAKEKARDSISIEGWAARPYQQLARAHAAAGELGAATSELNRAIEREPTNWRLRAQLSGLRRATGDEAGANRAFRRAERLYTIPDGSLQFVASEMQQLAG